MTQVELVSRAGCHLCAEAEAGVRAALVGTAPGPGALTVLDVDGELGPYERYRAEWSELVPVLLIDGAVFGVIRIDTDRFRARMAPPRAGWRPRRGK